MTIPIIFYFESKPPHRYLRSDVAPENPCEFGMYFTESLIYTTDPIPDISVYQKEHPEKRYTIFRNVNQDQWYVDEDHREIFGVQEATKYWMPWSIPGDPPKTMTTIGALPLQATLIDPISKTEYQFEVRAIQVRRLRNILLKQTDHFVLPDYQWALKINDHWVSSSFTENQLDQIYQYRQSLRNISQLPNFPFVSVIDDRYLPFPQLPDFLTKEVVATRMSIVVNQKILPLV